MPPLSPRRFVVVLALALWAFPAAVSAQAVPAPRITSIVPRYLSVERDTQVEIHGTAFTRSMVVTLEAPGATGGTPLKFQFVSATLVRAVAPKHPRGLVDAVVRDGSLSPPTRLGDAAEYVAAGTPAPQEIEATLVDGITEIRWVNPVPYRSIRVLRNEVQVAALKGTDTFFRDPTFLETDRARYCLVAETAPGLSALADLVVAHMDCPQKPFNLFTQERGAVDFDLYGMHTPYDPAPGGGQFAGDTQVSNHQFDPVVRDRVTGRPKLNYLPDLFNFHVPNEVVTGFTLFEPAKKLKFEVHAAKVQGGPNLSLRALVQSVTPGVERTFEIALPDVLIDPEHRWMELTYNTENPPRPPDAEEDDPDPPAEPPLPAADYQVKLYAVGGVFNETHYSISSDITHDQILVPGVGCPPYPLVRVTDTTGKNSNPVIDGIYQDGSTQEFLPLQDEQGNYLNTVVATLKAQVSDPDLPPDPIVKYKWSIDMGIGIDTKETASDSAIFLFPDYGYYLATLTVQDARCGKTTRRFVVKVHPPCISPPAGTDPNFTFPSPKPNKLHFISNLPGNMDSFWTSIPATFRAFVVDPAGCEEDAVTRSVQFALFAEGASQPLTLTDGQPARVQGLILNVDAKGDEETVLDSLEANDQTGARFWVAKFPEMRKLPDPSPSPGTIRLMARASASNMNQTNSNWGPWRAVQVFDASKSPIAGSERVNVHRKPAFLDLAHAYSTGTYDVDSQTYNFKVDLAAYGTGSASFPDTDPFPLPFPGEVEFPSLKNQVKNVSQAASLSFSQGFWSLDSLKAGAEGVAFNGTLNGTRELLKTSAAAGGGEASGFDPATLSYDYCDRQELFRESYSTTLFDSIIYAGAIGPVQVTVSASVSLGVGLSLESQTEIHLHGLDPANPFEAHFWLLPEAEVSLGASIRADIFMGVVSVEGGVDFNVAFKMPFHLGIDSGGIIGPEAGLKIDLDIDLWFEACIDVLLTELCAGFTQEVYHDTLVSVGNASNAPSGCSGSGAAFQALQAGNRGPILINSPDHQLDLASSPLGTKQLAVGIWERGLKPRIHYLTRAQGGEWSYPPKELTLPSPAQELEYRGIQMDPKVVFVDESRVLVAWTQGFSHEDPDLSNADPTSPVGVDNFNRVLRRNEIVYVTGAWANDFIDWEPAVRLTNDQGPDGFRADGRVSLASLPGQDAVWAAWVRFETPDMSYLVEPPQVDPDGKPLTRVHLRETSIYARRITGGQPAGALVLLSGDNDQIDIEPTIAAAADGTVMAAWVNDALHDDLLASNVGRNILFTVLAGGVWSAPAPVIADVSTLPAILEPSVALAKQGNHAMLAFTALPENANETDTGLQNTRLLYATKYFQGVWQEPVLIFKKCDTPLYAHWGRPIANPELEEDNPLPDWTIFAQEVGPLGTRLGAGNVVAVPYSAVKAAWGTPINLTPDDRLHKGIAATLTAGGEMLVLDQSPFFALRGATSGRTSGKVLEGTDVRVETRQLTADPEISKLSISNRYAAPGSKLAVTAGIRNHGFRKTPFDLRGQSVLALNVYFQKEGEERFQVADLPVPVVAPGEEKLVSVELTMPREPVRLIVEVDGVSGEFEPADNARIAVLGAPAPRELTLTLLDNGRQRAVALRWKNGGLYDRVQVFRDGRMLRELRGDATSFVDTGAGLLHLGGLAPQHEYSVRGVIDDSRSLKVTGEIETDVEIELFRRGDVDGNGTVEITDAIALLGHLFLGQAGPACQDAADADDNGELEITDGIRVLSYLFLGGAAPPAPGAEQCGSDPTADDLAPCQTACLLGR